MQKDWPTHADASPHSFQSFWWGGNLSPYELFCLKSFVDCGHAFDLYTFDPDLCVPAGVRVCDASQFSRRDEVFVYQEGFGEGSPSAFANLFRYSLLLRKGGWWVDTDVVCRTDRIPAFTEFFAHEDATHVNNAILYFEPGDPIIVQCHEEATKLGRAVQWGQTGPQLLTRVLKEQGRLGQALPPSVCYPVHYNQALDILLPAKADALAQHVASSIFYHLWNAFFEARGIQKTRLPPKGSLLRQWVERHPVDGWLGEYDVQGLGIS